MHAAMKLTYNVQEVTIGFHPEGYRIDRSAAPLNRYTQWDILPGNRWRHPRPVCFHELPTEGWIVKDKFDWDKCTETEINNVTLT
jgi:hypothetical protein